MDPLLPSELAALGHHPASVTVEPQLHNLGNAVTGGIWRVRGEGFSYVLKVVRGDRPDETGRWPVGDDPRHWNYWRREPLAYETDLPDAFAGSGLRAPVCYAVVEREPKVVALWLEDVPPTEEWTVERVARTALQLGRAQGTFLAGRPLPDEPWLSRRWLRAYIASKPVDPSYFDPGHPVWRLDAAREAFPPRLIERLGRLWEERERLLQLVESLPLTLCHLDFWPANLVAHGDDETVAIDWAFAGLGALGEDASNLVPDTVADHFLPASSLPDLDAAVYAAYRDGLRDAGWNGNERTLRLGYTAAGVKYCWLLPLNLARLETDAELRAYGGESAHPLEFVLGERAAMLQLVADWTEEALGQG